VLVNLLPGIREVRAPLVAGYLWLLAGWLAIGRSLPSPATATGLLNDVYDFADSLSRPVLLAAASLAAYLLGIISTAGTDAAVDLTRRVPRLQPRESLSQALLDAFDSGESGPPADISQIHPDDLLERLTVFYDQHSKEIDQLRTDIELVPVRLLGRDPELYAAYDRLHSEATFRAAVVPPLAVIAMVLAYSESSWWLFAFAAPALLALVAMTREADAFRLLAEALRAGRVESPVLEAIRSRSPS
jgi:hypothetical protein